MKIGGAIAGAAKQLAGSGVVKQGINIAQNVLSSVPQSEGTALAQSILGTVGGSLA